MFGSSEMALERTKVRLLGSDSAVVLALWRMTGQVSPGGAPVGDRAGVFTFVVERRRLACRFRAEHRPDRRG